MHRIELTRSAVRSLRRIPQDRVRQIFGAFEELAALPDPTSHQHVKAMKGDWAGSWRMRIGSYRAIFAIAPDPELAPGAGFLLILIQAVGPRGDIY
ncbi:type II toxin-antitoxin system RelE/ParE family toxin [Luteolibacter flavescens]|uniref:Type II toxin-antitoxin system RelE/ParE family toxin n=1 Tax=Luteolibacter flavescens TaxID=1859460 RepID=A0ABT3FN16_9BACT|nr:type II toxin-antitoxin system RelE/ParE family toxin [Luteolibacter flavescens]MCW1884380.1 type II toxin-antitoxin system RelE/ParE family toxin [Luteolibacter flavescens]